MRLLDQTMFEQLIGVQETEKGVTLPSVTGIYFTASWCTACRRVDLVAVQKAVPGIEWLKCDVDVNQYTGGYCGIRSIPSFLVIKDKKILGTLGSSDTAEIVAWLQEKIVTE